MVRGLGSASEPSHTIWFVVYTSDMPCDHVGHIAELMSSGGGWLLMVFLVAEP